MNFTKAPTTIALMLVIALSSHGRAEEPENTQTADSANAEEPAPEKLPCPEHKLCGATLFLRRLGPIEFGMTVPEAGKAIGEKLEEIHSPDFGEGCHYARVPAFQKGLIFTVENEKIACVDVSTPEISTKSGARVGISVKKLLSIYPNKLNAEPNKYDEDGTYIDYTYVPSDEEDKEYLIIFRTAKGTVAGITAGMYPAVAYVEGCY